ncbi:DUF2804 domain-containing protein [Anaerolentibacter hominis]|uniref:DUF2804 domain-containing protein n=1 Tax=Anaerolentibacter hominis TaxID=3079009 RepID=UPI0031B7F7FB
MRNHEVINPRKLLGPDGSLAEPGWSRKLIQTYDRRDIKAPRHRIKEWDYYLVLGKGFGAAFTISDDGYIGLQSVSFLDFTKPWEHTNTILVPFPMGKLHMPATSDTGDVVFENKKLKLRFIREREGRRILCDFPEFEKGRAFSCDIRLHQPPMDSMVIATPWKEKPTCFYYNQKINCMRAEGYVKLGEKTYRFSPEQDFGTLDWGRGVWTYDNTWYWGSGNGIVDGRPFGFNIGYGFGDTAAATENVILYDGRVHKLNDITFHIPKPDYMGKWQFSSSDGRFEIDFVPVIDRAARINAGVILTDQHQVFGRMSGRAVLDDGTVLNIQDLLCFAEEVHNKY